MPSTGRRPTHPIDLYRSQAWYEHLKAQSGVSDYELNKRFGRPHLDAAQRIADRLFEKIRSGKRPATAELVNRVESALHTGSALRFHAEFWELLKHPDATIRPLLLRLDAFYARAAIGRIMPRDAKLFPKLVLPTDEYAAYARCLDMTLESLCPEDRTTAICLLTREARLAENDFMTNFLYGKLQTVLRGVFREFLPSAEPFASYDVARNVVYGPSIELEDEAWLRLHMAGWLDRFVVPISQLSPVLTYCRIGRKGCEPGVICKPRCADYNTTDRKHLISTRPEWADVRNLSRLIAPPQESR